MENRITYLFKTKQQQILSVFFTAGFPEKTDTASIAQALEAAGVDLIEIGIPFSDPIADGPTIQESNKIALDGGMTVALLLQQVADIRPTITMPIVLMGYLNPVMQYGVEKFLREAARAGVDGLILPDLPLAEYLQEYKALTEELNLSVSFLIAPTTSEERIREIDAVSTGFIYAVSSSSTTGAKAEFSPDQQAYFKRLHAMKLNHPCLIGFGISNAKTWQQANAFAAGAIVGSSFIAQLKKDKSPAAIKQFVQTLTTP
jgi:tryptophan synthase alpha chain